MSTKAALQARIAKLEAKLEQTSRRKRSNVNGGSGEPDRGTWCTPSWLAEQLGAFDLDPCSNPRSHVQADVRLMLENGDNGLLHVESDEASTRALKCPYAHVRTFINPPYENGAVIRWVRAYAHTRFCFLLRFDPSTDWFSELYRLTGLVCLPRGRRLNFEPPPGVTASTNTFPHALFYKHADDATEAVLRACFAWRPR